MEEYRKFRSLASMFLKVIWVGFIELRSFYAQSGIHSFWWYSFWHWYSFEALLLCCRKKSTLDYIHEYIFDKYVYILALILPCQESAD